MFSFIQEKLGNEVYKYQLKKINNTLSYDDVISLWSHDGEFCDFFSAIFIRIPFDAFFWECRPVTQMDKTAPYEFVVVKSNTLAQIDPDPEPFRKHFEMQPESSIVSFKNLGGDAVLVSPKFSKTITFAAHLGVFLRMAPQTVIREFWKEVASSIQTELDQNPLWLSTSGLGVYWLHVRLDRRPKYYQYAPYRSYPPTF